MTNQPHHQRIDPALVVREGLIRAGTGHSVQLGRDATYTGEEVVTVVDITNAAPIGGQPGQRWAFRVEVSLVTTGPDYDAAAEGAWAVADAMLSLSVVDGVRVSSVICDSEPVRLSPHTPTGAEALVSRYSAIMRREGIA
ncbi:hypothetical protein [Corynebacterium heidelbergense]|uniref:DUF3168 domain-containing protein n=1 Tax=Corynebacterium heidelbergense TaxID=2055947 RepID=A0A364VC73_9CORY|nr:hypothetical protein [Corynebacterium heidelbergense]RAV34255.1 hypothetical protein CWC39_04180 [Corynebacterium heidelbergense]WCZ36973.1 hypothetical protein CHEID_07200 [Corynebacterium heidelbergense]